MVTVTAIIASMANIAAAAIISMADVAAAAAIISMANAATATSVWLVVAVIGTYNAAYIGNNERAG